MVVPTGRTCRLSSGPDEYMNISCFVIIVLLLLTIPSSTSLHQRDTALSPQTLEPFNALSLCGVLWRLGRLRIHIQFKGNSKWFGLGLGAQYQAFWAPAAVS